jgi:hypothetical protein
VKVVGLEAECRRLRDWAELGPDLMQDVIPRIQQVIMSGEMQEHTCLPHIQLTRSSFGRPRGRRPRSAVEEEEEQPAGPYAGGGTAEDFGLVPDWCSGRWGEEEFLLVVPLKTDLPKTGLENSPIFTARLRVVEGNAVEFYFKIMYEKDMDPLL